MASMSHHKTQGVQLPLIDGLEPLPDGMGVANKELIVTCSRLPEACSKIAAGFNQENLASRNLDYVTSTNVTVSGQICDAVRFRQIEGPHEFSKWAVFYPHRRQTVLFLVTFDGGTGDVDQIASVKKVFSKTTVGVQPTAATDYFNSFAFTPESPFKVGHHAPGQVILTQGGTFPLTNQRDPLITIAELPMKLVKQQFKPYIQRRLESIDAIKDTMQVAQLSSFVFAISGKANFGGHRQHLHARYFFLPRFVINAEAFLSKRDHSRLIETVQKTFDSIRPKSKEHQ